jgi:phage terminase small subunit
MNTDFETEMPDNIYEEWDSYTPKQKRFLMYLNSEKYDQTESYKQAGFSPAGAKQNAYKLVAKLKVVWEWMEYWKAHKASSEGVVTKNEMLKRYSEEFRDKEQSVANLIKLGKEIATICVYYPETKQDMAKKSIEMQNLIQTEELPIEVQKEIAQHIREQRKLKEKTP